MASELEVGKIGVGAAPSTYQLDVTTTGNNGIRTGNGTDQVYMGSTGGAAAIGTLSDTALNVITNGTSRLSVTNYGLATFSNGIAFSGQTDTSATGAAATSTTLDHYEEGTWTATMTCGSGTITVDTTADLMRYTRIGRVVHFSGSLTISAISSPSSWARIVGLPFPNSAGAEEQSTSTGAVRANTLASDCGISGLTLYVNETYDWMYLQAFDGQNQSNITDHIGVGTQLVISGSYTTDA